MRVNTGVRARPWVLESASLLIIEECPHLYVYQKEERWYRLWNNCHSSNIPSPTKLNRGTNVIRGHSVIVGTTVRHAHRIYEGESVDSQFRRLLLFQKYNNLKCDLPIFGKTSITLVETLVIKYPRALNRTRALIISVLCRNLLVRFVGPKVVSKDASRCWSNSRGVTPQVKYSFRRVRCDTKTSFVVLHTWKFH